DAPPAAEEAVIVAFAAVVAVMVAGGLLTRRRTAARAYETVRAAVARHRPAFMMYFSAPAGSAHHVGMWLPYLSRLGTPFIVVVREGASFAPTAALTDTP